MSLLDKLVKVNISISTAVADAESFDNILIVGPAPAVAPTTAPSPVGEYTSLDKVEEAGFKNTDPIYKAASIAFRNGAPKVYVAVQQSSDTIETTLGRALETSGWYGFALCGDNATNYEDAATWADANNKLFGFTLNGTTNSVGNTFNYAFGFATGLSATKPDNIYTHIAVMCNAMRNVASSQSLTPPPRLKASRVQVLTATLTVQVRALLSTARLYRVSG